MKKNTVLARALIAAPLALLIAAPVAADDPAKSAEALCSYAYGTALGSLGLDGARAYFNMGGYNIGVYSIRYSEPMSSFSKQMKPIPDRELKSVLTRCAKLADKDAKALLGQ